MYDRKRQRKKYQVGQLLVNKPDLNTFGRNL